MNKNVEAKHVGGGFVRKTIACHISRLEVIRGEPRLIHRTADDLITKRLEEEAGLESHYNKPFVSRQVEYIPDAEVYRVSLTWFEFESNSNDRATSHPFENLQQYNDDISEEMEPPC